jgi:hypothetical protein
MKVLILSNGEDAGGVGIGIKRAFDKHAPGWEVRCVRRTENYIRYPTDITWLPKDGATGREVRRLAAEADVLHLMQKWWSEDDLPGYTRKAKVIHHHGTIFRRNPASMIAATRRFGAVAVAGTLDLVLLDPGGIEWLPAPYDLEALARLKASAPKRPKLRIAHAPTNLGGKSTAYFREAAAKLAREFDVEVDVITHVSWKECLMRKALADVYFDQVLTGYGNNAIESWGMGLPVIAGADAKVAIEKGHPIPLNTLDEMRERWGALPFLNATEDGIYDALVAMVTTQTREAFAQIGRSHAEHWHDEQAVVKRLQTIYRRAAS